MPPQVHTGVVQMPTDKPRVTVTLEPSTHELIDRLATLQKRTRGAVIADLLDSVAPAMGRTVSMLEAAAVAPAQVKAGLLSVIEGIHQEFLQAAGEGSRRADALIQQAANPHVVTRGSHPQSGTPKKATKKPSSRSRTRDAG